MNKHQKVVQKSKLRRIKARIYMAKTFLKKQDAISLIPIFIGFLWNYAFDIYDKISSVMDIVVLFV